MKLEHLLIPPPLSFEQRECGQLSKNDILQGGGFLQTEEVPTDIRRSKKEDRTEIQTCSCACHKNRIDFLPPLPDQKAYWSSHVPGLLRKC